LEGHYDVYRRLSVKDVMTLLTCLQQADEATMLKVMESPTRRRTVGAVEKR